MDESKQTAETDDNPRHRLWITLSLGVFMSLFYLWAFYPALVSGFTLIDDSTINASALKWLNSEESIFGILYRPDMQGGARYTPTFWIIKAILNSFFGYQPAFHHAFHLFTVWIPIVLLPVLAGIRYRLPYLVCLPLPFFILSSGNGWSHNLWNVYDVSTFDPYAGGFLALAVVFFERIVSTHSLPSGKNIYWFILFFLSLLLLVHCKETIAIGTLGCAVLLLITAFLFQTRKKQLLILSAISFIAVAIFFIGFFVSGAYGASKVDEYTSNYQISPSIMFGNAIFTLELLLKELAWILIFCAVLILIRACQLVAKKKEPSHVDFMIVGALAVFCSFTAAVLPTSNLEELPRLLFIPYIALCLLISLTIISFQDWLRQLPSFGMEKVQNTIVYGSIFLFVSPLIFIFPKAISYGNFYSTVLGSEWKSVIWVKDRLQKRENDEKLSIVTPDTESMYWGLCIHLKNMGIEPYSQTEMVLMEELDPEISNKPILMISRNKQQTKLVELGYHENQITRLYSSEKPTFYDLNLVNIILLGFGGTKTTFTNQPVSSPILIIEE